MNRSTMAIRQVPPRIRMPMPLRAVILVHALFAGYLIDRDVFSHGAFAAAPLFATLGVAIWLFIEPGRHARLGATALSLIWMFVGYGFVASVPILIALWALPSVRAYLRYADEWRLDHVVYRTAF